MRSAIREIVQCVRWPRRPIKVFGVHCIRWRPAMRSVLRSTNQCVWCSARAISLFGAPRDRSQFLLALHASNRFAWCSKRRLIFASESDPLIGISLGLWSALVFHVGVALVH